MSRISPFLFRRSALHRPVALAENVIIAAGHGMIGMATCPASGKLAAELVAREKPHIDPTPYSLRRFKW